MSFRCAIQLIALFFFLMHEHFFVGFFFHLFFWVGSYNERNEFAMCVQFSVLQRHLSLCVCVFAIENQMHNFASFYFVRRFIALLICVLKSFWVSVVGKLDAMKFS